MGKVEMESKNDLKREIKETVKKQDREKGKKCG